MTTNSVREWMGYPKASEGTTSQHNMGEAIHDPEEIKRCPQCFHDAPMHGASCSQPSHIQEVRRTSSTGGQKGEKPEDYSLIPREPLAAVARLMKKGAKKYAAHNWRKGYPLSQSYNAAQRHLQTWWDGEDNDPEMNESHLAAVIFHCMVMMQNKKDHPQFDDRYQVISPEDVIEKNIKAYTDFLRDANITLPKNPTPFDGSHLPYVNSDPAPRWWQFWK